MATEPARPQVIPKQSTRHTLTAASRSQGDSDGVEAQILPLGTKVVQEGYVPIAKWWKTHPIG